MNKCITPEDYKQIYTNGNVEIPAHLVWDSRDNVILCGSTSFTRAKLIEAAAILNITDFKQVSLEISSLDYFKFICQDKDNHHLLSLLHHIDITKTRAGNLDYLFLVMLHSNNTTVFIQCHT